jgi:hypothetical protein
MGIRRHVPLDGTNLLHAKPACTRTRTSIGLIRVTAPLDVVLHVRAMDHISHVRRLRHKLSARRLEVAMADD